MGSQSDWATMRHAAETLEALGVPFEARIVSAHRTPKRMMSYAAGAKGRGLKVIIAGAGGAAHLPGMTASMTPLPVLGVPVESAALKGQDSLLSIVQMPAGIPVGTLAIGRAGAINAAPAGRQHRRSWRRQDHGGAGAMAGPPDRRRRQGAVRRGRCAASLADELRRKPLPPGSTIGILGGGQLGRMTALAAARLGYRCIVYSPGGAFDRRRRRRRPCARRLRRRGRAGALRRPGRRHHLRVRERAGGHGRRMPAPQAGAAGRQADPPRPAPAAREGVLRQLGIDTAQYQAIRSEADIAAATALPGILKTCTRRL